MDLKDFKEYFNKNDAFSVHNKIMLTVLKDGYAEARITVEPSGLNLMGTMHGGVYYTLADVAAGCAMVSYGTACVTLSADIHYMRPVLKGKVVAQARVERCGGKIGVVRVKIKDEEGEVLCICTITMYQTGKPVKDFMKGEA